MSINSHRRRVGGVGLRPLGVVVLAALAGGCAARPSASSVANVHTVVPGRLVRGTQTDAAGLLVLKRDFGIQTVVNLNDRTEAAGVASAEAAGVDYVALPSNPFKPDEAKLVRFLQVVQSAAPDRPVYVHCKDGMDRTGYAVATYRIVVEGWTADAALEELQRYQSWPHTLVFAGIPGFVRSVEKDRAAWRSRVGLATPG